MNKIYGDLTEQIFLDQCPAYGIEWISEEQLIELKKRIKNIKYSKYHEELIQKIETNILFLKREMDNIKKDYIMKEYNKLKQKEH